MNDNDERLNQIIAIMFLIILFIMIGITTNLVYGEEVNPNHEIQTTDDYKVAKHGTYFSIEYNNEKMIVTASHVVTSLKDEGMLAKEMQVERDGEFYPVEVILYDKEYDVAVLTCPPEIPVEYTLENKYYSNETDVTIIGNLVGIPIDVYFDTTIASGEFTIPYMWKYVQCLSSQSGSGSSGSPVCLKNTNICVGVLVGGVSDRDLTLMVPSVRILELLERIK